MKWEEKNCSNTNSGSLVKKHQKALDDAYIEFRSIRSYELKGSKFKGALCTTKTDRIVLNNEFCSYINLDSLSEVELNRSLSSDNSTPIDKTPEIASKQKMSVGDKAIEHIIAATIVGALFFLIQHVLGDPAALVTSFMVVVGYFMHSVDIAIK